MHMSMYTRIINNSAILDSNVSMRSMLCILNLFAYFLLVLLLLYPLDNGPGVRVIIKLNANINRRI